MQSDIQLQFEVSEQQETSTIKSLPPQGNLVLKKVNACNQ